jgi:hypothetical protein
MTFSIGIVAHERRTEQANELAATVNADKVFWDDGRLKCEGNHKQAWQWMADNNQNPWSVVLEDDAIPCDDFRNQLAQALEAAPTPVVSLYLGRSRPQHWQALIDIAYKQAKGEDASWITGQHLLHAVGVAIRTDLIPHMLRHVNQPPIDTTIGTWARTNGHDIAYTLPSLVNHDDGPTLIHHPDGDKRNPGRVAWWHGTRSPWTNRSVDLKSPPNKAATA